MPKNAIKDWSETASDNTDVGGTTLAENVMPPSAVNNAFRELMAQVAVWGRRGTDVATASTLNLDNSTSSLIDITGTTTVTAVTLTNGHSRWARATGAFQMTASASLVVNGSTSVNYTTTAGDLLFFQGYGSSVVRVWIPLTSIVLADGSVTYAKLASAAIASNTELRAGTASKLVNAASAQSGMGFVNLTDGTTVAIDHRDGTNRKLVAAAARAFTLSNVIDGLPLNIRCEGNYAHTFSSTFDFGDDGVPTDTTDYYTLHFLIQGSKARFMGIKIGQAA